MNAYKYFTCVVLLALTSRIYSQIPDTVWTKTFGGPLADVGNSVKQTDDGGFIIAGTTSSFGAGGQDIWLIKTDENGDTVWTKTFGGAGNDRASNVVQTNDNGYAVFGTINSFGNGGDDFLLWKTDSWGNTEWYKTFGNTTNEKAFEGQQTSDSGYVIIGDSLGTNNKAWLIKTDTNGNLVWAKTIGSNSYGVHYHGQSVQSTEDGGYVVSGIHSWIYYPSYASGYFLSKVTTDGNLIFTRNYGTYVGVWGVYLKKLSDGNFILSGTIRIDGGTLEKPYILKTDQIGNVIWDKIILGSQYPAVLTSIEPTNDNGFIFTIYGPNISLLKCGENGDLIWEKIVSGPQEDRANSIGVTSDGGYVVAGQTKSFGAGDNDIWLLRLNYVPPPEITVTSPNGGEHWFVGEQREITWTSTFVDSVKIELSTDNGLHWMRLVESTPSDGIYEWYVWPPQTFLECKIKISNKSNPYLFDESDSTFVIDIFSSVNDSLDNIPMEFALLQNFPNPFNPITNIQYAISSRQFVTLKFYDVLGNEIATLVNEEKQPGTYKIEFNVAQVSRPEIASGIYFYQLKAGDYIETKKMLLLK